jgi:two-component system nitrate/nitrite response regulator NarL
MTTTRDAGLPLPGTIRVAVLEDHRLVRESIQSMLTAAGMEVPICTGDAQVFLSALSEARVHVALVDLTLDSADGLSGHEVLDLLREGYPDLLAVVLSATSSPEAVERCFHQGVRAYLLKLTATSSALVETLLHVAQGERIFPADLLATGLPRGEEPRPRSVLDSLTPREREVLAYIASGANNATIGVALQITERTVKAHVSSLYAKLRQDNRAQLALLARKLGVRPASVETTPRP